MPSSRFAPLYIVGLGPGSAEYLAPAAFACLERCEVVCGYDGYIKLVAPSLLAGKEVIATGMTGEVARAKAAVERAALGRSTAVVCSGDPGVYALAGLVMEIVEASGYHPADFPLEVIPGIPAVCAAAALLGAPLMHDFSVISLSDLLTPWETILHRLDCAFKGDFVTVLYNPRSRKRSGHLEAALALAKKHREAGTPVGIVRNAFRKEQKVTIAPLSSVNPVAVDMFTIVLIGNSASRVIQGKGDAPLAWENGARMLTPRGYAGKYENMAVSPRVDTKARNEVCFLE